MQKEKKSDARFQRRERPCASYDRLASRQNNISQLVASLKSASSRIIRKEFKTEIDKTYSKPVFWSGSYYIASCGGVTIERLRKYIEKQNSPND